MYWKSRDLKLFCRSAQCCRFLVCVTCSVACCASCWYQNQSKNWHSWLQGREDFWHQIMSSVLSWPPAIQTLPCRCISAFTFQWQQPPNPRTGTSAPNLTRLLKKSVWVPSQLIPESQCRAAVPPCALNAEDCSEIKSWFEWEGQESGSLEIPS